MILDSKAKHHSATFLRTLLHLCVSALDLARLSDPILGSGFKKPLANVPMHAVAASFTPLPAAYFGEKSALLTVAITVSSVF